MSSIWQLSCWEPRHDCGTPGLYRSRKSILKSGTWSHRMSEWAILVDPAQPLQTENGRWIVFKWVRSTKRSEFVDVRLALFHVVRFDSAPIHSRELQSLEIRSLTLKSSVEGIHPEFECRAQNRVHVDTALIYYASRPLRYRRTAFKEIILCMKTKF